MTNIINLADHRPPAPRRPSRFTRLARWSDDAPCTLVVAAGLYTIAGFPGHVLRSIFDVPSYLDIFVVGIPTVLVGLWAVLSMCRLQRNPVTSCSMNVHVFEDETAGRCKCGATGDVDGDGAA